MKKSLLLAAIASIATHANAVEFDRWQADKSVVSFVFKQMNVPVEGRFKRFKGKLNFDPAKPTQARAELEIELASIDAGSTETNDEVAGKLWFDSKNFPSARFVSSSIKPLGNNRFEVVGNMSIKGRTHEVMTPAILRHDGGAATFEGGFTLKRADYAIGEGLWADFGTVANEIQIKFRLTALAAGKN